LIKDRLGYNEIGAGNLEYVFSKQVSKRKRIYMLRRLRYRKKRRMKFKNPTRNDSVDDYFRVKNSMILDPLLIAT
jgi:hypothetical protein